MKTLPGLMVTPLLLALCFLGTPTALNAHGGDTSLIHACVKKTGALRIIAADGTCKKTETALDWNVAGPAPLAVYDANGNIVGPLLSAASGEVSFTAGTRRFSLMMSSHEFFGNTN